MNRGRLIAGGITLIAIAAFAAWFFATFEQYEELERSAPQGEARTDRFLAAKRMLDRLGHPSFDLPQEDWETELPRGQGTLIVNNRGQKVPPSRLRLLDNWVRQGGQLILDGPSSGLSLFGADDDDAQDTEEAEIREDAPRTLMEWAGIRTLYPDPDQAAYESIITLRADGRELHMDFRSWWRLEALDTVNGEVRDLASDENGSCALEIRRGYGSIIALCNLRPFTIDRIGHEQHATALWTIVSRGSGSGGVWWSLDADLPPLHHWLYARAPEAVVAFTLALLVWMLSRTGRPGPRHDIGPRARRRTAEHIEASGRFTWRHGGADALIAAMRNAFMARLERRQPAWAGAPRTERLGRLAKASGIAPEAVFRAVEAPVSERADFIEAVRNLSILWRSV